MDEIKRQGLCIKSIDYKENDKLITIYAFGEGKISANCRGVKKPKAKLRYASNILCFGTYILNKSNNFYTVTGCDLIDSFYDIWCDVDKYYPALACMEILDRLGADHEISDILATNVIKFLKDICYTKLNSITRHFIRFMLETLSLIGYEVHTGSCAVCGERVGNKIYLSSLHGGVVYECCHDERAVELTMDEYCLLIDIKKGYIVENSNVLSERKILSFLVGYLTEILASKLKACEEYLKFLV